MSNSKKAILSAVSVVCIISILSFVMTFFMPHEDAARRKELAGSLDFLIVGASQAQNCFIPE